MQEISTIKQSTVRLLEAVAEEVMQTRRMNRCNREHFYEALIVLHEQYGCMDLEYYGEQAADDNMGY